MGDDEIVDELAEERAAAQALIIMLFLSQQNSISTCKYYNYFSWFRCPRL